jgi:hypothetical protein
VPRDSTKAEQKRRKGSRQTHRRECVAAGRPSRGEGIPVDRHIAKKAWQQKEAEQRRRKGSRQTHRKEGVAAERGRAEEKE